jgi:glycosyltransferase involved in cell wall biosynthesis
MLISFIVPVHNAANFLKETIESILNCGYAETEIVLVDDGSSDSSPLICKKYSEQYPDKIRFFQHDDGINKGVSETRRLAILKSSGEFIFFLDADD